MTQLDLFSQTKNKSVASPYWRIKLGRRTVQYTLRRSGRAKHVWLRVGIGTGLEVVAPAKMALKDIEAAIEKKHLWVERHLQKAGVPEKPAPKPPLEDGITLPYLGREVTLRLSVSDGPSRVRLDDGSLLAAVPPDVDDGVRLALESWYKKMARKVILEKLERLRDGKKIGRVTIRSQKTRWGSCSTKGNLNFNWRLVMAPHRVIDYLIVHELTHLDHPDHSKRFWAKVARRCPDYKRHEEWLLSHGRAVMPI